DREKVWETVEKRWLGLQNLRELIGDENLKFECHGSWDLITEKERELFNETIQLIPLFNQKLKDITGEENVYQLDKQVGHKNDFDSIKTSIYNRLEGQIDTASMNDAFYKKVINQGIRVLFGTEVTKINSTKTSVTTHLGEISA